MKNLFLVLALSAALAQSVPIGPAIFSGSGLNDATSGGTYTSAPGNHLYVATISATGTPDSFTWTKDGGSASSPVAITGSAQTLTDGVTITFAATTGHTLAAAWTIAATANGSLGSASYVARGVGALVTRNAQDKLRDFGPTAEDFGAIGNGTTNDTAAIQAALNAVTSVVSANRSISLTPGKTYLVDQLTLPTGVSLVAGISLLPAYGSYGQSPQLVAHSAVPMVKVASGSRSNSITGINFNRNGVAPVAIYLDTTIQTDIENDYFEPGETGSACTSDVGAAIRGGGVLYLTIDRISMHECGYGLDFQGAYSTAGPSIYGIGVGNITNSILGARKGNRPAGNSVNVNSNDFELSLDPTGTGPAIALDFCDPHYSSFTQKATNNYFELTLGTATSIGGIRICPGESTITGNQMYAPFLQNLPFSVTSSSTTLTLASPALSVGSSFIANANTGTLPSPLVDGTTYYVLSASGTAYTVAASMGSAAINFTTTGSGAFALETAFPGSIGINAASDNTGADGYEFAAMISGNDISRFDYGVKIGPDAGAGNGMTVVQGNTYFSTAHDVTGTAFGSPLPSLNQQTQTSDAWPGIAGAGRNLTCSAQYGCITGQTSIIMTLVDVSGSTTRLDLGRGNVFQMDFSSAATISGVQNGVTGGNKFWVIGDGYATLPNSVFHLVSGADLLTAAGASYSFITNEGGAVHEVGESGFPNPFVIGSGGSATQAVIGVNGGQDGYHDIGMYWKNLGNLRALFGITGVESGSSTGSNPGLLVYSDSGGSTQVFGVTRSTGILNFTAAPTIGGQPIGGTISCSGTQHIQAFTLTSSGAISGVTCN